MQLGFEQLAARLARQLDPVYLVSGDEPLQMRDAADQVRRSAREQGFTSRDVFEVDKTFDWRQLKAASDNMSLFAERRLLDVRLASASIGRDGSQALVEFLEDIPPDTMMLISAPKVDQRVKKTKWAKCLDKIGVMVQVWPVEPRRLKNWLQQRMLTHALVCDDDALSLIAYCSEGNLLAADQIIERLRLLSDGDHVGLPLVEQVVSDSARFDVYGLAESALAGHAGRAVRMLHALRGQGVAAPVVLWALVRDVRILNSLYEGQGRGAAKDAVFREWNIWERRRPLYVRALQRYDEDKLMALLGYCAEIDFALKGQGGGDEWVMLERLVYALCGVEAAPLN